MTTPASSIRQRVDLEGLEPADLLLAADGGLRTSDDRAAIVGLATRETRPPYEIGSIGALSGADRVCSGLLQILEGAVSAPTRIDDELFERAKLIGSSMSRSASQQINHWARLGCELEASGVISHAAIAEVLAGNRAYDDVGPFDQAVIRAAWTERIEARLAGLDLAADFATAGRDFVELDEGGNVVRRHAGDAATTTER